MNEKNQITEGVIWKQLLFFFFPVVAGMFLQQIYNAADTIVVGRFVGKEALAAVGGSVNQIVNLIVEVFVGLTSGASVIISQFYGAKDQKNLDRTIHTAYALAVAAGIIISILGIALSKTILSFMKTPEELMSDSAVYLRIYFLGIVFNLVYNMGASALRAVGDSRRPLYVLAVACSLNVALDLLLVVKLHMGVAGAAIATITCQGISACIVTGMLMAKGKIYRLRLRKIHFFMNSLRSVLKIGIPAGFEAAMYCVANIVIQVFVNKLGTDYVAAWGTFGKIDAAFWMIVNAFGISITTFVGQNYGAGKTGRMRKSVRVCLLMSYISAVTMSVILMVFARSLYGLFTTDTAVIDIGVYMMRFLMPSYFLYVVIGILSGALRGAGRVLVPVLLTCGGVCVLRIAWMLLLLPVRPGIETIMLSYPASWSITAVLFIIYYIRRFPGGKGAFL
ncbi:MAG TPA: MATE family efflux transporter [Candidatus Blautia faecipullorum]|nr:MATE family efflux transporter [Candidatus Blautia faecipullorum]